MLIFGVQKLEMVSHLILALIQLPCPAKGTFVRRGGSAVEMKNALIFLWTPLFCCLVLHIFLAEKEKKN